MELKQQLIDRARRYCEAEGISMARLSTKIANDGKFLTGLEDGKGLTVARYEKLMGILASLEQEQSCAIE